MDPLDALLALQIDLAGRIGRFGANTTKARAREAIDAEFLDQRVVLLDRYWDQFNVNHEKILQVPSSKGSGYLVTDSMETVEAAYLDARVALVSWKKKFTPESNCSRSDGTPSGSAGPDVHLPTLQLPTFSGDLATWESFKDQFIALVHSQARLSNTTKLTYLKSSLSGEAKRMLERTPITDARYEGAWESLERRYGNKRLLSGNYMRRLLRCAPAVKGTCEEYKRLLDEFRQTIEAFQELGKPVELWDEWFLYLLSERLDTNTRVQWEVSLADPTEVPRYRSLESFLETRMQALRVALPCNPESSGAGITKLRELAGSSPAPSRTRTALPVKVAAPARTSKPTRRCLLCSGDHTLGYCPRYRAWSGSERWEYVQKAGICSSCLCSGHPLVSCPSKHLCVVCDQKHHTSLHDHAARGRTSLVVTGNSTDLSAGPSTSTAAYSVCADRTVLLATARVCLESPEGRSIPVRALLDSGSESSFVSEWAAQALRLRRRPVHVSLAGFQGREVGVSRAEVQVILRSRIHPSFSLPLDALVSPVLTTQSPSKPVSVGDWKHISGLQLADPEYSRPANVDLLLGADICGHLWQERREGPPGTPTAVSTPLGWVLLGNAQSAHPTACRGTVKTLFIKQVPSLDETMQRFWEVESVPTTSPMTAEEQECEDHFARTHSREPSGRYMVRLPFRQDPKEELGESRSTAVRILFSSERRQGREPRLKEEYVKFLTLYRDLDHMGYSPVVTQSARSGYYFPHHAVWKSVGEKSAIRVVFNASSRTTSGKSLNDCLMTGPKLQAELWLVLTRWRLFKYAFSADIVKMFRQIRVHHEDRDWLRILWRPDPSAPVQEFRMTTVTYGTSSAPFQAQRVLRQLADDEVASFPLGAEALRRHSYVDDLLVGAASLPEAEEVRRQLEAILMAGGFPLDKWASNAPQLCPDSVGSKLLQEPEPHGALGLLWETRADVLAVKGTQVAADSSSPRWTKRTVLSAIAKLFDPLGWLAPVLVRAKILLQDLWLSGVNWDEPIPQLLSETWLRFLQDLPSLDAQRIPRWVGYGPDCRGVELHGFCDASERAYAAAVYLRIQRPTGDFTSHLLISKTKVAPIKTLSIPRLELCGAHLLARLLSTMVSGLEVPAVKCFAWTDSSVALTWLRAHASRWKPFVSHRVAEVQELLAEVPWGHVRTHQNPADLATRGIPSRELQESLLWWHGPQWLYDPLIEWPHAFVPLSPEQLPEHRASVLTTATAPEPTFNLLYQFSSFSRLLRVTAFLRRFAHNAGNPQEKRTGFLTSLEMQGARDVVHRLSQRETFPLEVDLLSKGKPLPPSSPLLPLKPFLDAQGVVRVGGRLEKAPLTESRRHPVVVARQSPLARLVILQAHLVTLHGGFTLTRCQVMREYWILRGRVLVKGLLRDCVRCLRFQGTTAQQQMGSLPVFRLEHTRPFLRSGVDYAGPIQVRTSKGRGHRSYKGYIAVFVCLSTKGVHLELVSDLTAIAFLAAFRRFVSRRGRCAQLLSDNGTNFHGADSQLRSMFGAASEFYRETAESMGSEGTEWTFIPPMTPHFGGLWEAAVKFVKHHMRRVIGEQTLTFEELTTLLCQIEACLNSRPLCSLSDDPEDLSPLTPGHFLVGAPITAVPEPPSSPSEMSLAHRWRLITNLRDHFWRRWKAEYLHDLQQCGKWKRIRDNLKVGTLVIIKEDHLPPTRWLLARVVETFPGTDGLVRVVNLKTATGFLRRPINKLVPLPVQAACTDPAGTH